MSFSKVLPEQPPIYPTTGALPSNAADGDLAVVLTSPPSLYLFDGTTWNYVAGGSSSFLTGLGVSGELALWDSTSDLTAIAYSASSGTSNIASRDSSGNSQFNNLILGYSTIVTAGGTTTLTAASPYLQYFTGTLNQSLVLPVTSTLVLGQQFQVINNSSGTVTVKSSGGNTIEPMPPSSLATFTVILTSGTTAASWNFAFAYQNSNGTVTSVQVSGASTGLTFTGGPITTNGTINLGGILAITNGGSGTSTATGSGNLVLATSPTLTTPQLGNASATTINNVTITGPATGSTFTLLDGKTFTVNNSLTFGGTDGTLFTFPSVSDTVMGLSDVQTATNKTLSNPKTNNIIEGYTTQATSTGTTTLTVSSNYQQFFTGSTTQTVTLPQTSTLTAIGQQFQIVNQSTGVVTVQSYGTNTVQALAANSSATFTAISVSGDTAAAWSVIYSNTPFIGALPIASGGTNSSAALTNGYLMTSSGGAIVVGGQAVSASSTHSGSTYTVVASDFGKLIRLTDTVARAVTMITTPVDGFFTTIEDTAGTSYAANITLTAGGSDTFTINGTGTYVIDSEYAAFRLQYDSVTATWEIT